MQTQLILIAAIAQNQEIGYKNQLLWHLPNDLKHFKRLTLGNTIIMGRKTYDSIGCALPNRVNIVVSKTLTHLDDAIVVNSIDAAFQAVSNQEKAFVIGGETLYKQTMHLADILEVTLVETTPNEADAFFPKIDLNQWECMESIHHPMDEKHKYPYSFKRYLRKSF